MRTLLLASALIVLTAAAAPAFLQDRLQRLSVANPPDGSSGPARSESRGVGGSSREVAIKAHRDGHFYVNAEINFRPVRFMVDTGASVVALRKSDAEAIGIRPPPGSYEHPVSTANGTAYAAEAELDSVAVEDIELAGVRALILPDEQLGISLLGASFLNRLERFQVSDGTLVFEN